MSTNGSNFANEELLMSLSGPVLVHMKKLLMGLSGPILAHVENC